eukprot:363841-Chlamydomonas_euryale.AAC.9
MCSEKVAPCAASQRLRLKMARPYILLMRVRVSCVAGRDARAVQWAKASQLRGICRRHGRSSWLLARSSWLSPPEWQVG